MNSCIYCGEASVCLDHVIPYSYTSAISSKYRRGGSDPGFRVPACTQCNSILGDRIFENLVERKAHVHTRLKVKLDGIARSIPWDEQDKKGLGKNLKHVIDVGMARRQIARDRIRYSAGPPESRWLDMEIRWRESRGEKTIPKKSLVAV